MIQIARLETDQKCSIILSKLKGDIERSGNHKGGRGQKDSKVHEDKESAEQDKYNASHEFDAELMESIVKKKGFESQDEGSYICILFDLLLYRYPALARSVFELLSIYFLRTRTITSGLLNVQILESSKSISTLN